MGSPFPRQLSCPFHVVVPLPCPLPGHHEAASSGPTHFSQLSVYLPLLLASCRWQWDPPDQVLPQWREDPPRGPAQGEEVTSGGSPAPPKFTQAYFGCHWQACVWVCWQIYVNFLWKVVNTSLHILNNTKMLKWCMCCDHSYVCKLYIVVNISEQEYLCWSERLAVSFSICHNFS